MSNTRSQSGDAAGTEVPVVTANMGATADPADLDVIVQAIAAVEMATARLVGVVARVSQAGLVEAVEAMSTEQFLAAAGRLAGADRTMVTTAADVLATMPVTAKLFADGALGWALVRRLVSGVKRANRRVRAEVDARVAATAQHAGGLTGMDVDQLAAAIDAAITDAEIADLLDRDPNDNVTDPATDDRGSFLALQLGFDGRGRINGELDAVATGIVVNALDAASAHASDDLSGANEAATDPTGVDTHGDATYDDGETDHRDEGLSERGWTRPAQSRRYAGALVELAATYLGGDPKVRRRAKPLIVVHTDLADIHPSDAGTVEIGLRGQPTRIHATTLDVLAASATLRVVLTQGTRPLAVSEATRAATVPATTRLAVTARDRGCRFPGSNDPLSWSDVHHLRARAAGGDHHPDNLLTLSRANHTRTHRGWRVTRPDDDGLVTFTSPTGRVFTTSPCGRGLARPPDADAEPPDPEPPDGTRRTRRRRSDGATSPDRRGPTGRPRGPTRPADETDQARSLPSRQPVSPTDAPLPF